MVTSTERLTISRIWARDFKSLRRFDMALAPLTVLVGRNGSGKSNALDVLRFVSDAFYDGVQNAVTYRNGPSQILRVAERRTSEFTVGLAVGNSWFTAEYELTVRANRAYDRVSIPRERISLITHGRAHEIIIEDGKVTSPKLRGQVEEVISQVRKRSRGAAASPPTLSSTPMLSLIGDQPAFTGMVSAWLFPDDTQADIADVGSAVAELGHLLGEMRFYRIFPDTIREPQPISLRESLEEDGGNFASVLKSLQRKKPDSFDKVVLALQRVAPGVTGVDVRAFRGSDTVRVTHSDPTVESRTWSLDIAQESDGTVRALALLLAVMQDPSPSLIAIEEPELGLHAGVLPILVDLMEEVSERSQILISTHSSELLDFVAPDSIRAMSLVHGESIARPIAEHQRRAIQEELLTAGYIHRLEGLGPDEEP